MVDKKKLRTLACKLGVTTAIYLVVAIVAWLIAGSLVWWMVSGFGGLGFFFLVLAAILRRLNMRVGKVLRLVGFTGSLLGLWIWIGIVFARSDVYVDNFSSRTVRLELDDSPWLEMADGTTELESLRQGAYQLVIKSMDGRELARRTLVVDSGRAYVLNVLSGMSYVRESVAYGFAYPSGSTIITDEWFPAHADYIFTNAPEKVSVPKGTFKEVKYVLRRGRQLPSK